MRKRFHALIITLLILSFNISAQDTPDSTFVPVPTDIAREVIKDLERYDLCREEKKSLERKLTISGDKISYKDSIISELDSLNSNYKRQVLLRESQISNNERVIKSLKDKVNKRTTERNLALGGIVLSVTLIVLL